MKPFLKWAGNKYRIADRIKAVLPEGKRLIEPFSGAAALFLNTQYPRYLIGDSNPDLINLYQQLKSEKEDFIKYAEGFFKEKNNQSEVYYDFRQQFNHTTNPRLKSALFLYLNKHGYNGLCRYNQSGGYNVPFGQYKRPYFPRDEMLFFIKKAQKARFIVSDFILTMDQAKTGDIVYCDPPYVPLSKTAAFTQYAQQGFTPDHQILLANKAQELQERGITVIISNHDTPFTREIYSQAQHYYFEVRRNISCDGAMRNTAPEILAIFKD